MSPHLSQLHAAMAHIGIILGKIIIMWILKVATYTKIVDC